MKLTRFSQTLQYADGAAHRSMHGVAKCYTLTAHGNTTENIPVEELETIGIGIYSYKYTENMLRKEHGLAKRLLCKGVSKRKSLSK